MTDTVERLLVSTHKGTPILYLLKNTELKLIYAFQ